MPCGYVSSRPPFRTVREAFTSYGSTPSVCLHGYPHEASVPISPAPRYFPRVQRARSLGTFVPVFPKARDLCLQFLSWCTRLSRAQTTTSLPPLLLHLCSRLGHRPFGERSPLSYFPSTFASLEELPVSAQMRLKRDTLGGVFLGAPSALCGSPMLTQGKSGLPVCSSAVCSE